MEVFDKNAMELIAEVKRFFTSKGLMFYKIEEEQQGTNRYIRITVSLKVDTS
jgi:hypothetical protein